MNWKFTTVHHPVRVAMGLSLNEYAVLDIYFQSQTHPDYTCDGWAKNSYADVANFFSLTKGCIHKIVSDAVDMGLMEVNPANPHFKRTTENWYRVAYLKELPATKIPNYKERLKNERQKNVQKMNEHRSKNERNRSENERHNKEEKKKGSLKRIKPKTAVLRNTPFDTFWKLYGNKVGKQRASTAFARLTKDEQQAAIEGLKAYDEYRSRPENSYLEQMHPTTYLHGKRWNDEYPPPKSEPVNLADQPIDPSTAEKYNEAKAKLYTSYPALKEVQFFKHSEFVNFVNLSPEYLGANWKTRATERQIKEKHCELLAKLNNTPYLRKTCPGIYPYLQTEMRKILYQQ